MVFFGKVILACTLASAVAAAGWVCPCSARGCATPRPAVTKQTCKKGCSRSQPKPAQPAKPDSGRCLECKVTAGLERHDVSLKPAPADFAAPVASILLPPAPVLSLNLPTARGSPPLQLPDLFHHFCLLLI